MAKLKCPKCKSPNVQLFAAGLNTKKSSSLNMNPLSFTLFNHKEKPKRNMLGQKKKTKEFHCNSCGKNLDGKIKKHAPPTKARACNEINNGFICYAY